jgi:hypothetical protein
LIYLTVFKKTVLFCFTSLFLTKTTKARFVARGFSHKKGEDYDETFAPVARRSVHRAATRFCDLWEGFP